MRQAQQYLEQKYPTFIQRNIKKLDLSNLNLTGTLDLGNFIKLEELNCADNLLTKLDLRYCLNLKKLNADNNKDLQLWWGNTLKKQVEYLDIKPERTIEEIKTSKVKKQRRKGCFINPNLVVEELRQQEIISQIETQLKIK